MKRKSKTLIALLAVVLTLACIMTVMLAACNGFNNTTSDGENSSTTPSGHVHAFSDKWSYDDEYHWHDATCGHDDQVKDREEHTVENWNEIIPATKFEEGKAEGVCTVCHATVTKTIETLPLNDSDYEEIFEFKLHAATTKTDAYYEIISYSGNFKTIIIPTKYKNIPVKSIGSTVFNNRSGLTKVIMLNNVTSIGNNAFSGCINLKEITIPDSVTSIGHWAFYGCTGLQTVTIGNSVTNIGDYTFTNCKSLTGITIPDSVIGIGVQAFSSCSNLQTVTIGNSVTSIAKRAFSACSSLKELTLPDSVTSIGDYSFQYCSGLQTVTIGDSLIKIGDYAFYECTDLKDLYYAGDETQWDTIYKGTYWDVRGKNQSIYYKMHYNSVDTKNELTEEFEFKFHEATDSSEAYYEVASYKGKSTDVVIPENHQNVPVTKIGCNSFQNRSDLSGITIPNSVTRIDSYAFDGCKGLKEIVIPNSVTHIGMNAFYGCTALQKIVIGEGVKSIGDDAFGGCSGFQTVEWNAIDCTYAGAFGTSDYDATIFGSRFDTKVNIDKVIIGQKVQTIPAYSFYFCTGFTELIIPNSVTSIGRSSFSSCTDLQSVIIGEGMISIGDNTFYQCTSLQTAIINAQNIGDEAFYGCTELQTVTIGGSTSSIGEEAFFGCKKLKDLYYEGDKTQWGNIQKGERWNRYYDRTADEYKTIPYQMHFNSTVSSAASTASEVISQNAGVDVDAPKEWVKQD